MRCPALASPLVVAALLAAPPLARAQSAPPLHPVAPATKPAATPKAAAIRPATSSKPTARPASNATPSRDGIESLEVRLDAAADRVSAPQLLPMLGRPGAARGYRLPGYGIVVVLTPRALPGTDVFSVLRPRRGVRVETHRPGQGAEWVEAPELDALERQVVILQHESEETRRAAEETQQRIVETVRYRLASPGEMTVEVGPAPPEHAPPPEPAAPAAPPVPATPAAAPPAPAEAPTAPAPPPWKFWFSEVPRDERTRDAVVADVRAALVDALTSHPGRVVGLGPEEFVTVVVDFEDGGRIARRPRPERTLVVRARVRDMEARSAGAITSAELRGRLEVLEY